VFCLTPFCYPQVIPRHRGLTWVASGQIPGNGTAADALRVMQLFLVSSLTARKHIGRAQND